MTISHDHRTYSIAVVIPAKNEQSNIGACIEAISRQEYPQSCISVVLVDNGSTDRTVALAESLGATVLIDSTASIAKLRNIGAATSESEIIAFLDADMIPGPRWLKESTAALANDKIGAIGGTLRIPENPSWVERIWCMPRFFRPAIYRTPWLPSGNLVMRHELFKQIGGFDASLTTSEDVDLCARIRAADRELYILDNAWVIHTGESKTLRQFVNKEIWRGRNHLQRSLDGFGGWRDALSLALPIAHLVFLLGILVSVLYKNTSLAVYFFVFSQVLPTLRGFLVAKRVHEFKTLPQLLVIWNTYYFARSIGILLSIKTQIGRLFTKGEQALSKSEQEQ